MSLTFDQALGLGHALRDELGTLPIAVGTSRNSQTHSVAMRFSSLKLVDDRDVLRAIARLGIHPKYLDKSVVTPRMHSKSSYEKPTRNTVHPGLSFGHINGTAGTLGALVYTRRHHHPRLLGAGHILTNAGHASPGDLLLQPGPFDGGTPNDAVATLGRTLPLAVSHNRCDVALGRPLSTRNLDAAIADVGPPRGMWPVSPPVGTRVFKRGRSTSLTHGVVSAVGLSGLSVELRGRCFGFDDVIEVRGENSLPFSLGGDSGALVLDRNHHAIGIVFAGDPTSLVSFVCPIAPCLDALKVTLAL